MYLDYFLAYGSQLAEIACLACTGLACWQLSKVLRERAFVVAAYLMGISVGLLVIGGVAYPFSGYLFHLAGPRWYHVLDNVLLSGPYQVGDLFLFLFFVLFCVGAVRRGLGARKPVA